MNAENKFTSVMAKRSDGELLEIVTKLRNDYQPEAVEAAEAEIQKRNLSSEQVAAAEEEIKTKEKNADERANEPLEPLQKIMFFVFFWGVFPWAMASTFKAKGYTRKYKDAWRYMGIGFLCLIAYIVLKFIVVSYELSKE